MSHTVIPPPNMQRLADFHVTLFCPEDESDDKLEQVCQVLDELDLRAKLQGYVEWYIVNRSVLRKLAVEVEE